MFVICYYKNNYALISTFIKTCTGYAHQNTCTSAIEDIVKVFNYNFIIIIAHQFKFLYLVVVNACAHQQL